jgi:hypothetical protein
VARHTPHFTGATAMLQSWMDDFSEWAKSPFKADMSAFHWALFIGLLLVIMAGWGFVFRHIQAGEG